MILAIDAGFESMGWALVQPDGAKVIDAGIVRTKRSIKKKGVRVADDDAERCQILARGLSLLIRGNNVSGVICEMPSAGAQGARANRCMGMSTAIVASVVECTARPAEWVTPNAVKQVAGNLTATKEQIKAAVLRRWPEIAAMLPDQKTLHEHICDAAAAFMAAENGQLIRVLRGV